VAEELPPIAPQNGALAVVIGEFGRHLDLLAEQLGESLAEADRECVSVGDSFHDLAAAKTMIEGVRCNEPQQTVLRQSCTQIDSSLHTAVVALQYHDRLAQKLALIRAGLQRLQALLRDPSARSHDEWLESLRFVENQSRLERRRLGPEAVSSPADAALPEADGSVELF